MYRTLTIAAASLAAAAALAPTAASAQYRAYDRAGYARGYDHDGGDYRGGGRRYYDAPRQHYRQAYRCDAGTGGTILGAIAGGLLGNTAVGRNGDRTAGTVAGAGVGALLGRAVDRDC